MNIGHLLLVSGMSFYIYKVIPRSVDTAVPVLLCSSVLNDTFIYGTKMLVRFYPERVSLSRRGCVTRGYLALLLSFRHDDSQSTFVFPAPSPFRLLADSDVRQRITIWNKP